MDGGSVLIEWLFMQQAYLHGILIDMVIQTQQGLSFMQIGIFCAVCFAYGFFHAAGPGHGKVIIGTYALTTYQPLHRVLTLSMSASMAQGAFAICIIGLLVVVGNMLPQDTQTTIHWSQRFAFVAIIFLGLHIVWQSSRMWFSRVFRKKNADMPHACTHTCAVHMLDFDKKPSTQSSQRLTTLALIASVAFRPCSGAILVLVLSASLQLFALGVSGVVLMSLGTGIGVATVALVAITTKRIAKVIDHPHMYVIAQLCRFLVGIAVICFGVLLFEASFAPRHPLGIL